MDLNYLLSRHQISLMSADAASCSEERLAHLVLAAGFADRVRAYQQASCAKVILSDPI